MNRGSLLGPRQIPCNLYDTRELCQMQAAELLDETESFKFFCDTVIIAGFANDICFILDPLFRVGHRDRYSGRANHHNVIHAVAE